MSAQAQAAPLLRLQGAVVVFLRSAIGGVKTGLASARAVLRPRRPGRLKGQIWIAPDFDEPLPDGFWDEDVYPPPQP